MSGECPGQRPTLSTPPHKSDRVRSTVNVSFQKKLFRRILYYGSKKWVYDDDLGGFFRGKFDIKPLTLHSCVLSESAVEEKWSFTDDLASRMWFA